jgi:hypothetical protein
MKPAPKRRPRKNHPLKIMKSPKKQATGNKKRALAAAGGSAVAASPRATIDTLGRIRDFAHGGGVAADQALALMSFLLAGIAGQEAWLGGHVDGAPLAKLDLLIRRRAPDEPLRRLAGRLVARLRGMNRELALGLEDYSEATVELVRRGALMGGPAAKFADPEDTRKASQRLRRDLQASPDANHSLEQDLRRAAESLRVEALLHPQFLLESVRCRDLTVALDACHQRTALVVAPQTDPEREGSEPAGDLRGLLDLMEGLATPRWNSESRRSRILPLKGHVLFEAGGADLALIARLLPAAAGSFLWLTASGSGRPAARSTADVAAGAAACMEMFTNRAMKILELRREGESITYSEDGEGPDSAAGPPFDGPQMDRYRRWVGRMGKRLGIDPGPVVRELPGALCFGLGMLCRQNATDAEVSTGTVMAAALWSARRLARQHCRELVLYLKAELLNQAVELARRILDKLEEKGPLTLRELVRCFDNQRKERFLPVIEAMVELRLVARRQDGKLAAGEADLFELEGRLRERLFAATTAPGHGAKRDSKTSANEVSKPPAKAKGKPKPRAAKKAGPRGQADKG